MKTMRLEGLKDLLLQVNESIAIIAHRGPDGDAMGSSLGLYHILKKLGKSVKVVMPTSYPAFLHWMPANDMVVNHDDAPEEVNAIINDADLIFCLDFNTPSRVEPMTEVLSEARGLKVLIDHHPQPDTFAQYIWSDTSASSTAQLIVEFAEYMDWTDAICKDAATCLYTGILTDTGSFRFPSTKPLTHRIVATLIEKGADNAAIYNALFDENRLGKLQLLGYCLSEKLVWLPEYNTAYVSLSLGDLQRFSFEKGDTEGIVNYALSVKGVRLAAIFIENEELIKISLRSKGDFSVNQLSRDHFSGGGHTNAAGGRSLEDLNTTVDKFVSLLPSYKQELS